jgi:hypothetical protein
MAKYRIIETRPATAFWEYIVEADDENQALEKVFNCEIEAEDHGFELDNDDSGDDDDSTFEIFEEIE